jgi:uracil-DNA glycosylase
MDAESSASPALTTSQDHAERSLALAEVHTRLHACRLCLEAGYDIFPRAIFSGGVGARIMLIGQAPGITEKDAGRPFNAGSGKRLFQWLAQAGIEESWFRSTQYMTAITKCYPGRAKSTGEPFLRSPGERSARSPGERSARPPSGDRVPSLAEQRLCRPYLEQEIALVNPQLILPVGRLAISRFFPPASSLDQIIGTSIQHEGRWVVPLPHPSGASRWHQTQENRQRLAQALAILAEVVGKIRQAPSEPGISGPA